MKYYSIKYIQTIGLIEAEIEEEPIRGYIRVPCPGFTGAWPQLIGSDVFERREDAIANGVKRLRKLAVSARRRATKLNTLADELETSL